MAAEDIIATQRRVQDQVREADRLRPVQEMEGAMQAGARRYPEPPFSQTGQDKPGIEQKLSPTPLYDAPYWAGSGKLQDKVAIITGGDSGIGRAVAILFAREGADVAILHLESENADAAATAEAIRAEGRQALTIAGNVIDREFCFAAATEVADKFK